MHLVKSAFFAPKTRSKTTLCARVIRTGSARDEISRRGSLLLKMFAPFHPHIELPGPCAGQVVTRFAADSAARINLVFGISWKLCIEKRLATT